MLLGETNNLELHFLICSYSLLITRTIVSLSLVQSFDIKKLHLYQMSLIMREPAFCICENKDADQLRGSREADQHLCFRYTDSTIPLLSKSEISSF